MAWSYVIQRAAERCPEVSPEALHRRIGYASYVSLKHRYLYYQVSKAGCTTMKWLLHEIEELPPIKYLIGTQREARRDMFIHERSNVSIPSLLDLDDATQEHVLSSPDFMRFTVVRNPYARLESAWRDKVRLCAPTYELYTRTIKGRLPAGNDPRSLVSFEEFVATLKPQDMANCDPHWRLQTVQTLRDTLNFTHVGRLEGFAEIERTFVAHCGHSAPTSKGAMNRMPSASHYDHAIADRVYDLYREDFAAFDYGQDSWVRPSANKSQTVPESSFIDEVLERNLMINLLYDERDRLAGRVRDLEKEQRVSE